VREDRAAGPHFVSASTGERLFNWNHPDAYDLARLLADIDSRATAPDAPDVLLVEGLMALHFPDLRQRLALRLFVDLDADVRALRRLLRDMAGGRASRDPEFIARYYRESARVGHARYVEPSRSHADLLLRGDADFARLIPLLCAVVEQCMSRTTP
jgi:uridine kinase